MRPILCTSSPFPAPRAPVFIRARVGDPDASVDEDDPDSRPPTLWHKVASCLFYLIPWMDVATLGLSTYYTFKSSWCLYFLVAPLIPVYYASPFIPLVVFFVVFLAVVRNKKIPHLVRFNACQAIMIDICAMMFNLLRMYFPAEVRWYVLLDYFDKYAYVSSMALILYSVFWSLRGHYADLPFISEESYIQVELAEHS